MEAVGIWSQIRVMTISRSVDTGSGDSGEARSSSGKSPVGQEDECGKATMFQAEARTAA